MATTNTIAAGTSPVNTVATVTSPINNIATQTSAAISTVAKNANATVKKTINNINTKVNVAIAKNKANSATQGKPWKTSFWACCVPWDLCFLATFCPCFVFGKTWHRVENGGDMTTYGPFNLDCSLYCLSTCFLCMTPIYQAIAINTLRMKLNLEGSVVEDFLKAFCCPCCALMQSEKEAKVVLGAKRSGMDGITEHPYAAGAGEKMIMAPQGTAAAGPTRLNRISEEASRSRAGSNATVSHDNASEITAVNPSTIVEPSSKLVQTDGAAEATVVQVYESTDSEVRLQIDGSNETPAAHVGRTKNAAPHLSIAESALQPLWEEIDLCEKCPNCTGTK
ncbi:hypothetical protein NX059_007171 [Plenodomus lindquistii]|nr:hypothetical protein NX059_007171 [Plenodomus lindquistii]